MDDAELLDLLSLALMGIDYGWAADDPETLERTHTGTRARLAVKEAMARIKRKPATVDAVTG